MESQVFGNRDLLYEIARLSDDYTTMRSLRELNSETFRNTNQLSYRDMLRDKYEEARNHVDNYLINKIIETLTAEYPKSTSPTILFFRSPDDDTIIIRNMVRFSIKKRNSHGVVYLDENIKYDRLLLLFKKLLLDDNLFINIIFRENKSDLYEFWENLSSKVINEYIQNDQTLVDVRLSDLRKRLIKGYLQGRRDF